MPKSKKTAIYFYCQEQMRKQHRSMSMKDAIDEFYTNFKALSSEEKSVYERMCAEHRDQEKYRAEPEIKVKIDPLLTHPEYNVDRADIGMKELKAMFNLLNAGNKGGKTAGAVGLRDQSAIDDQIRNNKWYFIKFVTFCRTDSSNFKEKDRINYSPYFVLAEVAMVEYSLKEGITKTYNEFITPNPIPLGYRAACMDSSENSHKIPLANGIVKVAGSATGINFNRFGKPYHQIYGDILDFIGKDPSAPLFCFEADNEATRFGLDYLSDQAKMAAPHRDDVCCFPITKIYDLECLLMFLAENKEIELVYSGANEILTSTMYDYSPNSLCDFHEDLVLKECALGYLKRSAYAISDNLCLNHYGVDLTPNHIPVCKPVGTIVDHSDFKSVMSRQSYRSSLASSEASSSIHDLAHQRNGRAGYYNDRAGRDATNNMATGGPQYLNHPSDARYRSQESVKTEPKYAAYDMRFQPPQAVPAPPAQPQQQPRPYVQSTRRLVSDKLESLSNRSQVDSESLKNTRTSIAESETLTTISGYDNNNTEETASVFSQSRMTDDGFSVQSVHMPSTIEGDQFDDESTSMISDDRSNATTTMTNQASRSRKVYTPANEELEGKLPGGEDEGWQEVRVTGGAKDAARQKDDDEMFMGDENSSVASSGAQTWQTKTSTSSTGRVGLGRGKLFRVNK